MIVFSIILVLLFPLITGVLFALSFAGYQMVFQAEAPPLFARHGFYLYLVFLTALFMAIFIASFQADMFKNLGLDGGTITSFISLGVVSVGLGTVIYYEERSITRLLNNLRQKVPILRRLLFSGQEEISEKLPPFTTLIVLSVLIAFMEEFVWRGFLLTAISKFTSSTIFALGLSSLAFGINHYYFGLRAVFLKTLSGLILGILFLFSQSILFPFFSHATFNILTWRKPR